MTRTITPPMSTPKVTPPSTTSGSTGPQQAGCAVRGTVDVRRIVEDRLALRRFLERPSDGLELVEDAEHRALEELDLAVVRLSGVLLSGGAHGATLLAPSRDRRGPTDSITARAAMRKPL